MRAKKAVLLLFLVLFAVPAFAQQGKFTLKVGVTVMDAPWQKYFYNADGTFSYQEQTDYKRPQGTLFLSYSLLPRLSCGLYGGYTQLCAPLHVMPEITQDPDMGEIVSYTYENRNTQAFNYGVNVEFDVLPPAWRIKLYAIGRAGVQSEWWNGAPTVGETAKKVCSHHCFEVAGGAGAAFYFTKRFGIYAEALGGRFRYEYFRWQAGLSFKF